LNLKNASVFVIWQNLINAGRHHRLAEIQLDRTRLREFNIPARHIFAAPLLDFTGPAKIVTLFMSGALFNLLSAFQIHFCG
jgi:hypothetical protein